MAEKKENFSFLMGLRDGHANELFEAFATGRWASGATRIRFALSATYTYVDTLSQMTKEQLVHAACSLNAEVAGMPVWGGEEVEETDRYWPDIAAIRAMRKEPLAAYLASAFRRAIEIMVTQVDIHDMLLLFEMAGLEEGTLIGLIPEGAPEATDIEGRIDAIEKYGNLISAGLLVVRRMVRFHNKDCYGLFVPEEVRECIVGHESQILAEGMLLDVMRSYAQAAANLYGVVTVDEFRALIQRYEKQVEKGGVKFSEGPLLDSIIAAPEEDNNAEQLIACRDIRKTISEVLLGYDRELVICHLDAIPKRDCAYDLVEVQQGRKSIHTLVNFVLIDRSEDDGELGDSILDVLDARNGKPRYYPAKYAEFMRYADSAVNEDVPALPHMQRLSDWLIGKHREEIAEAILSDIGELDDAVFDQCFSSADEESIRMAADEIAEAIYNGVACTTMGDIKQSFGFEVLNQVYGIFFKDMEEANEYLGMLNEINSGCRMYVNNGHTPNELMANQPPYRGKTTRAVGPGMQGMETPGETWEPIGSGGLGEDLAPDHTPVRRAGAKIGRNEPCPCGSGKKYKRCCGKSV